MGGIVHGVGTGLVLIKRLAWWILTALAAWDWYFLCEVGGVGSVAALIWWCWAVGAVYWITSLLISGVDSGNGSGLLCESAWASWGASNSLSMNQFMIRLIC